MTVHETTALKGPRGENIMYQSMLRAFCLLALLSFGVGAAADEFDRIYIFGDSLSDTGNLASLIGPLPPPYYRNRISNGPVAVDTLTAGVGLTADASLHLIGPAVGPNYAVAGARARGDEAIDLATQVTLFLANHGLQAPRDALYVIMIGGNDVRDARDARTDPEARRIIRRAVRRIGVALATLAGAGARRFLVVNVPDIGVIPETRLLAAATGDATLPARATHLSRRFNRHLHRTVSLLAHNPALRITEFDLFAFLGVLLANAGQYGFTNTTDPCFSSETFTFYPGCENGAKFGEYVFFDEIHPTTRVHAFIGMAMGEALEEEPEGRELAHRLGALLSKALRRARRHSP